MKTILTPLLVLAFSIATSLADGGIPVNRETHAVTVPHTLLTLTDSQREEIDVTGSLTLTSDQWKELRAIGPDCPKRIERVVLETYDDCGCDLIDTFYGIQLNTGAVAVTHGLLTSGWGCRNLILALAQSREIQLRVDARGQFYYGGALIPYPRLLEMVTASAQQRKDAGISAGSLGVVRPAGVRRKDAAVRERLDTLFKKAEAAGWEPWYLTKEDAEAAENP